MEHFGPGFVIGAFVSIAFLLLAMGIDILRGLILPGRRGYLVHEKNRSIHGSVEETERRKYSEGLAKLGFIIDQDREGLFRAHRPKSPRMNRFPNPCPLSFLPLNAELRFFTQMQDIVIFLKLKMNTFVYRDTGEGHYLHLMSDYLLSDEFDRSDPPIIPYLSGYTVILVQSLLALTAALSLFLSILPSDEFFQEIVLHGLGWSFFVVNLMVFGKKLAARLYPRELLTSNLGDFARILSMCALLLAVLNIYHTYEDLKIGTFVFYGILGFLAGRIGNALSHFQEIVLERRKKEEQSQPLEQMQAKPIHADSVDGATLRIPVPLQKQWGVVVFLTVWLTGWAFGEIMVGAILLGQLATLIIKGSLTRGVGEILFMGVWFTGWTIGGGFALYTWLWNVTGAEVLYLDRDFLRIEKKIAWIRKIKAYQLINIDNFRREINTRCVKMAGTTPQCFAFEYGGKTVRFGSGMKPAEVDQIMEMMRQRLTSAR